MQSYLDWNKLPDHHLKGDQTTQNDIPYIVLMIFNNIKQSCTMAKLYNVAQILKKSKDLSITYLQERKCLLSTYNMYNIMFVCLIIAAQAIFPPSIITGDRAKNIGLCPALRAFQQGRILMVPHLLRHRTSVYTVSFERLQPTSHSGIRTPDARIIRSLHPTL
jgi:hypothetical protein